jgi:hypothetical protein
MDDAIDWLLRNDDRYMEALKAMGKPCAQLAVPVGKSYADPALQFRREPSEADEHDAAVEALSTSCTHEMTWSYLHPKVAGARIVRTHSCAGCGLVIEVAMLTEGDYRRDVPVGSVRPEMRS